MGLVACSLLCTLDGRVPGDAVFEYVVRLVGVRVCRRVKVEVAADTAKAEYAFYGSCAVAVDNLDIVTGLVGSAAAD